MRIGWVEVRDTVLGEVVGRRCASGLLGWGLLRAVKRRLQDNAAGWLATKKQQEIYAVCGNAHTPYKIDR